jgi:hypothetical protein
VSNLIPTAVRHLNGNGALESPSLRRPGEGDVPAYELKFLLDEGRAALVQAWAAERLLPDAHGDSSLGGAYRTTTLYLDTPGLDVYHRAGSHGRRKYRLRRYGGGGLAFLERKAKRGDRVRKRRSAVPDAELPLLAEPFSAADWPGQWFHRRLLARRLRPSARVVYERLAYVGFAPEGPVRVTFDRRVMGEPADAWSVEPPRDPVPLLTGSVILELKFRLALPLLFKELIESQRLSPAAVSKYRLCLEAWGAVPGAGRRVDA